MAQAESDPATQKAMRKAAKRYEDVDISAAKQEVKLSRPGAGVKSLLGYIVLVACTVLCLVLSLTKWFPPKLILGVFTLVLISLCVAALLTYRATGHLSEDGLLKGLQQTLGRLPGLNQFLPGIGHPSSALPQVNATVEKHADGLPAPKVDFGPTSSISISPSVPPSGTEDEK